MMFRLMGLVLMPSHLSQLACGERATNRVRDKCGLLYALYPREIISPYRGTHPVLILTPSTAGLSRCLDAPPNLDTCPGLHNHKSRPVRDPSRVPRPDSRVAQGSPTFTLCNEPPPCLASP
ncbi:hypothetical protein EDB85DRAFT_1567911 [Lactarius pseudohatsudake]|nr:hypothetical protein EDB85DRAFT_1567911 [Lactarius pseudohatsudake]